MAHAPLIAGQRTRRLFRVSGAQNRFPRRVRQLYFFTLACRQPHPRFGVSDQAVFRIPNGATEFRIGPSGGGASNVGRSPPCWRRGSASG